MADLVGTDIITSVQGLLEDTAYPAATILEAANWYVNELYLTVRTRRMEASEELFPSAGDTELELPDDIQTLLDLTVTSPQAYNLMDNYVEYGDFVRRYPGFATSTASQLRYWTDFANGMRFAAPLDVAHTVHCDYLREPVPMAETTDTCEVKTLYGELVSKGTLARLMEINEDYDEAAVERKNMKPLVAMFTRNEGRGRIKIGPTVIGTNRGHSRGSYSQADF
jgi:hypothetical protein